MILEKHNGNVMIWNSKAVRTTMTPMVFHMYFNKHTNEVEYCDGRFFCKHYSLEELKSMITYLEKFNKEKLHN